MKKEILVKQERLGLLLIGWRIPGTITSLVAAIASSSMVVWMEFIENISILIPGIILASLSRKLRRNLKFTFNYGIGKLEATAAFFCEAFDIAGLFCVIFLSIRKLLKGDHEEGSLIFALVVTLIGVLIDFFILQREKKLSKTEHSRMLHTAYLSAQKEFSFDLIASFTLVIEIVFAKAHWIKYFSPITCIALAVPFAVIVFKHIHGAMLELIDVTLDEASQLKIIKVLNEFYDSYETLGEVKSRVNGKYKEIDLELRFHPDMKYSEVRDISKKIKKRVREEIGKCHINVNVT